MMRTSVETRVQGITPKALISSKFNFYNWHAIFSCQSKFPYL